MDADPLTAVAGADVDGRVKEDVARGIELDVGVAIDRSVRHRGQRRGSPRTDRHRAPRRAAVRREGEPGEAERHLVGVAGIGETARIVVTGDEDRPGGIAGDRRLALGRDRRKADHRDIRAAHGESLRHPFQMERGMEVGIGGSPDAGCRRSHGGHVLVEPLGDVGRDLALEQRALGRGEDPCRSESVTRSLTGVRNNDGANEARTGSQHDQQGGIHPRSRGYWRHRGTLRRGGGAGVA